MNIAHAISKITSGSGLKENEMAEVMLDLLEGRTTDAQIGAFLIALNMKGESVEEVLGAAKIMRQLSSKVEVNKERLVDTCGTGGVGIGIFNVSTTAAFVACACGARVAKHGNRSATRKSGSADLLEAAGVCLELEPSQVAECIDNVGLGFMFAPGHHSAMKHVIGPRKEIAHKSIFNILGPLTNPASPPNQVMGVYDKKWMKPVAEVHKSLGSNNVMVVHSEDNLDEISIASKTKVVELREDKISEYIISPEEFGFELHSLDELKVNSPEESLSMAKKALTGEHSGASSMVALNAGAALYVSGVENSLAEGIDRAKEGIKQKKGLDKLQELSEYSQSF
ncbi:MAG: anthranilate phosphoribosyltransferase [Gammaproteobacteria bacterium]|nr:anthranilate phosphoribosyltransferase [Gammaproteobacteria bacterium]HJL95596.1 anthranilate phosphoribosyltransferase [SAR86 cluster bacterium]|tara:strand:- start:12 stop:1028 length:1017 start_codon:yes stop_codon:yes gene_type:complete